MYEGKAVGSLRLWGHSTHQSWSSEYECEMESCAVLHTLAMQSTRVRQSERTLSVCLGKIPPPRLHSQQAAFYAGRRSTWLGGSRLCPTVVLRSVAVWEAALGEGLRELGSFSLEEAQGRPYHSPQ